MPASPPTKARTRSASVAGDGTLAAAASTPVAISSVQASHEK